MGHAERMSNVDRAWLRMDRPSNPMVVMGLLVLARPLDRNALRQLIAERFLKFERFRCIPRSDALAGHWMGAEHFNLDDHLFQSALPAPAGHRELETLAGEIASTPLGPDGRVGVSTSWRATGRQCADCAFITPMRTESHSCTSSRRSRTRRRELSGSSAGPAPPRRPRAARDCYGHRFRGWELVEKSVHFALHPFEAIKAHAGCGLLGRNRPPRRAMPDDPATA